MALQIFENLFDFFLNILYNIFDRLGGPKLVSVCTFMIRKAFTFFCCFLLAIQIFLVAYYFLIPNMQQELTLHFQKDLHDHYLGFYFNQDHKFRICQNLNEQQTLSKVKRLENVNSELKTPNSNEKTSGNDTKNQENTSQKQVHEVNNQDKEQESAKTSSFSVIDSDLKTVCNIHLHNQRQEIYFERESYQMNLRLVLFDLQNKGFSQGVVPIEIIILDRNGDSLEMKRTVHFNQNQKKRNILERIFSSLGTKLLRILDIQLDDNQYEIDQILFEKLPNSLIDLQAIIIKVQDVGIFIQSSSLVINPILKGIRYYLYYWFYSTSIIMILALSTYLFLFYYIYYCIKPCIIDACTKRRKLHYD
ncbi:transmembrane protein, putative (macronuclear) [Tetrahymena thermophila SB210]|uniref:Transmembrane protein, putative n=1 Tax=Tetrahymena thermophila (strain SB210) TaxID=312017 RepID=I7LY43_TETTS|nr:transmembrane protein, putative [Tetrahymena thermophila SB210]EAS07667.1 transmembrane protein, putative [Tetrahymena thermophila SB210]|eukprot:XP_001027909.1 transmembrane protein, putative [Tetrahymena thermophila SB210]